MEHLAMQLDAAAFDQAVHGAPGEIVLQEGGDLAVYVKPNATVEGFAAAVITFTVQLPDGRRARAQAVTTAKVLEMMSGAMRGWRSGGHIR